MVFLQVLFCSVYMIYMYWVFFRLCLSGPVKLSCIWDMWAPHKFGGHLRAGRVDRPRSLRAICGPLQFCRLLRAPAVCGLYVMSQFCLLMIDGMWALVQKTV